MSRAILVIVLVGLTAPAAGQVRLPLGTHVGSGTQGAAPKGPSPSSPYDDGGRRDPFVSLLAPRKAASPALPVHPIAGLSDVALADVAVTAVVLHGSMPLAVLEGPGGKSFVARGQDRLRDATVKAIDADGVVFVERIVDAGGAVRVRDVRKSLRSNAEGAR